MSRLFSKPRAPDLPPTPEPIEEIEQVEETAEEARRRERKKLVTGGRRATIISGIRAALVKRLGEVGG